MAQITGHIVQANGLPISEAVIVVTAVGHSSVVGGNIFKGTCFDVVCGTDGGYSFQLAVGSYSIQVKIGRTSVALDGVVVDNDTPDGIDILQLVAYDGVSVALAQQILNEATALSIAQETAVVSAILANDGVGSGLDADLLQGKTLDEVISEAQSNTYDIFKEFPKTSIPVGQEAIFNIQGFQDAYVINMMLVVNVAGGLNSSPDAHIDIFWYHAGFPSGQQWNLQLADNAVIEGRNWGDNYRDVNIVPVNKNISPHGTGAFKIVNVGTQDIEIFAIGAKLRK